MANQFIGDYPAITTVDQTTDLLPIVQGAELKTVTPVDLLGYENYVFNFTQSGTSNPTVTELQNSTGQTFTWTRGSIGSYSTPFTGTPVVGLSHYFATYPSIQVVDFSGATTGYIIIYKSGANLYIECYDNVGAAIEYSSLLSGVTITIPEIRIYN
jgi:hypothetical protein